MPPPGIPDLATWDHRAGCYSCHEAAAADADLPPRQRVWRSAHWRVVHAYDTSIPGWLIVIPIRHLTNLAELEPAEAAELGPLLAELSRALVDEVGCLKTYVLLLAEAEGFSHIHFHVVPRMPDQPAELRGPRIFGALGVPPEQAVPATRADRLATAIATRVAADGPS
jgi:diadenosine tetraphosphate (Ap4A) HIT family hydrolase